MEIVPFDRAFYKGRVFI